MNEMVQLTSGLWSFEISRLLSAATSKQIPFWCSNSFWVVSSKARENSIDQNFEVSCTRSFIFCALVSTFGHFYGQKTLHDLKKREHKQGYTLRFIRLQNSFLLFSQCLKIPKKSHFTRLRTKRKQNKTKISDIYTFFSGPEKMRHFCLFSNSVALWSWLCLMTKKCPHELMSSTQTSNHARSSMIICLPTTTIIGVCILQSKS